MSTLMTIGYEGRSVEDVVDLLHQAGADLVIDVRYTPISRKRGFSKTALRNRLSKDGIRYLHLKALGNPTAFRRQAQSVSECMNLYADFMATQWDDELRPLIAELAGHRVALLCFEHDAASCHRSIVAREVARRVPDLAVKNL